MFAEYEIILANPEVLRRRLRAAGEDGILHESGLSHFREGDVLRVGQLIALTVLRVLRLLHYVSFLKQVEPMSII